MNRDNAQATEVVLVVQLSSFAVPQLSLVEPFMLALEEVRLNSPGASWKGYVRASHEIRAWRFFLSLDPYTRWGLVKPRGYPGDATLMDFAYGHRSVQAHIKHAGRMGQEIYKRTYSAAQSQSARQRVALQRDLILDLCARKKRVRITSFASGHARELEGLSTDTVNAIEIFTAVDLDPTALSNAKISANRVSFAGIRKNVVRDDFAELPEADLTYSLGLFDYLSDELARLVLSKMLRVTGGDGSQCVVANLAPDAANLAYCESIMDWWMITRTASEMRALGDIVAASSSECVGVEVQRKGCFNYLVLTKG